MKNKYPFIVEYEDNHLIIVNKPAGLLVQGDSTGDKTLADFVKEYIKEKYEKPGDVFLGTIHRLDRPVSGLVMFARTSKALERMNKLMRDKKIYKTYWAVVKRKPPVEAAKLTNYLLKDTERNTVSAHETAVPGSQYAELTYTTLGRLNDHYLLEVNPITGRPHQIRVQLSSIGCPIRGDLKYGFPKPNPDASIHLHARRLRFTHPVKDEKILVQAGLPDEQFWEQFLTLEKLRNKDLNLLT